MTGDPPFEGDPAPHGEHDSLCGLLSGVPAPVRVIGGAILIVLIAILAFIAYELLTGESDDDTPADRISTEEQALPAWSPDGARIAFNWSGEIYPMSPTGSDRTQLTDTPVGDISSSAAWSPDSTSIVFETSGAGYGERQHLYVIGADGTGQTNLTDSPDYDSAPDWPPDGTRIAFVRGTTDIYVMDANGANVGLLVENAYWPSWSPDGTLIAFGSERDRNLDIYAMNADGSGQTRLTHNPADDYFPAWSPAP